MEKDIASPSGYQFHNSLAELMGLIALRQYVMGAIVPLDME
jgi:hypothetical protein